VNNAGSNDFRWIVDCYNLAIDKKTKEKIDRAHLTMLAMLMKLGLIFTGWINPLVGVVLVVKVPETSLGEEQRCRQENGE